MNEFEQRTYPSDEMPKRREYPSDEAPKRREYPSDQEMQKPAGKGRRGGNSGMSYVIRSEKKKTDDSLAENRAGRPYGERRTYGERRSSEERRSFGERRTYGEKKSYGARGAYGERGAYGMRGAAEPRRYEPQDGIEDFNTAREFTVLQNTQIGSFLDLGEGKKVLLPFAEQIGRPQEGERVSAYLYRDKGGRLTATMRTPILKNGELGVLKVADITRIGVFLDNGVPKQLLVPFKEQICTPKPGNDALVYLYQDKSGRQAATMRVYKHLSAESPYHEDDRVTGFVYEINPQLGVFLAVDNRYFGLIPKPEVFETYHYGQKLVCRVLRVREDGKLDLSAREKSYEAIEKDTEIVLAELEKQGGMLPYADRADAAMIESVYHMSKNQFKRAVGSLYRQRRIEIDRQADTIRLL